MDRAPARGPRSRPGGSGRRRASCGPRGGGSRAGEGTPLSMTMLRPYKGAAAAAFYWWELIIRGWRAAGPRGRAGGTRRVEGAGARPARPAGDTARSPPGGSRPLDPFTPAATYRVTAQRRGQGSSGKPPAHRIWNVRADGPPGSQPLQERLSAQGDLHPQSTAQGASARGRAAERWRPRWGFRRGGRPGGLSAGGGWSGRWHKRTQRAEGL